MSMGNGKKEMEISEQNFAEIRDHNERMSLSKAVSVMGLQSNVYGLQVRILAIGWMTTNFQTVSLLVSSV